MSTRFERNAAGMSRITRTMGRQAAVQAAQRGLAAARKIAPVRTGEYKGSLTVEEATVIVNGQPRDGARLVATDPKAPFVEWGRGGHHVLARVVNEIERKG